MTAFLSKAIKRRVKDFLKSLTQERRASKLERTATHVTREKLADDLIDLGVCSGDVIFVHSSLKSLGYVEGGPGAVIGALQDAVGPTGTLLLPTYYLPGVSIQETCLLTDYVFNPKLHGSTMGALPAAFLTTPGVSRSIHPTHSVSALGRHAVYLTEAHHLAPSVFGEGSPWQRFVGLPQSKVLGLGVSMGPVTFYHLAEDVMGDSFPVRVWQGRVIKMPCLDHQGNSHLVPVRAFEPDLNARRIDAKSRSDLRDYFAAEFRRVKLRQEGPVGSTQAWSIDAPPFLDHLIALAHEGITIYSSPTELAARRISGLPSRKFDTE